MSEWQPIETLPGTEDPVILWIPANGCCIAPGRLGVAATKEQAASMYRHSGAWPNVKFTPTHWMPLPPPPDPKGE